MWKNIVGRDNFIGRRNILGGTGTTEQLKKQEEARIKANLPPISNNRNKNRTKRCTKTYEIKNEKVNNYLNVIKLPEYDKVFRNMSTRKAIRIYKKQVSKFKSKHLSSFFTKSCADYLGLTANSNSKRAKRAYCDTIRSNIKTAEKAIKLSLSTNIKNEFVNKIKNLNDTFAFLGFRNLQDNLQILSCYLTMLTDISKSISVGITDYKIILYQLREEMRAKYPNNKTMGDLAADFVDMLYYNFSEDEIKPIKQYFKEFINNFIPIIKSYDFTKNMPNVSYA